MSSYPVPPTPRVISPSPTPSEPGSKDGYFPPTTRAKATRMSSVASIDRIPEHEDDENLEEEDPELARARARSRNSQQRRPHQKTAGMKDGTVTSGSTAAKTAMPPRRRKPDDLKPPADGTQANGFLSPDSAYPQGFGSSYWRNLSRSPSPLGLIPIHEEWRRFIHKHEVPRKALHVSIGFLGLGLYWKGLQPDSIHPYLLYALLPIFTVDILRFRWNALNRLYIWLMGPLMRESEAHDQFNGVISYLAGLWLTMRFCNKDIALMSVLLLSWCDTAASTFGRLWGKYTPRVRRGKSLAGSLACFTVGLGTAALFWGVVAPRTFGLEGDFAFQGMLTLPAAVREQLGWSWRDATIEGPAALAALSVVTGLVVSVSEAIDLWGLDDNLTIPIFCGIGLSGFLWACGSVGG
ncbi:Diacylglycerol kinase [Saxophila tyrrhenica]|uniref:Diacylglycerol kinase n=1 Tax=Saxophila tyrrhenica TaxID=1690608 RepID=A0AAV9PRA1_9PEZI|nr:Diacylglycerol kinase [Saxophila tyrrhenica]